jgi:hypothetical protein
VGYEEPAIADYGDLAALTASQQEGDQLDGSYPCGRRCDLTLS